MENYSRLEITALYRARDLPKPDFVKELKSFLEIMKFVENHLIAGDFNIDLLKLDAIGLEHLNNLMEK